MITHGFQGFVESYKSGEYMFVPNTSRSSVDTMMSARSKMEKINTRRAKLYDELEKIEEQNMKDLSNKKLESSTVTSTLLKDEVVKLKSELSKVLMDITMKTK